MHYTKERKVKRSASEIIKDIKHFYETDFYNCRSWYNLRTKWKGLTKYEKHQHIIEDAFAEYVEYKLFSDFEYINPDIHFDVLGYMENVCVDIRDRLEGGRGCLRAF